MSADVIKEFFVSLGFKEDASLKTFESTMQSMTGTVTKWASIFTSGAIAGAFADIVHEAEKLDSLAKLSFRVNASVDEIEKLGYVAELSGSSIDDVKSSLEGLSSAAGQTALGVGRAKVIFEKLGISVIDANGNVKDSLALMSEIGARIKTLGKAEQISVLDKLGINRNLLQTLTTDISDIESEFSSLYKTAGIDSEKAAKNAERFNDSLFRLKFVFSSLSEKVSAEFFSQLADSMDGFRKGIVEYLPRIVSVLVPALKDMLTVLGKISDIVAGFFIGIKDINDATGGWILKIGALIGAFKILDIVMNANPIGLLITGIASLIAIIGLLSDDFQTFKEGGKSYINWGPWVKGIDAVGEALQFMLDSVLYLLHPIDLLMGMIKQLDGLWSATKEKLGFGDAKASINVQEIAANGVPIVSNGAVNNANKSLTYNNPVTITVTGVSSPSDTANAISATQNRMSQNMVRNLQGNVR